MYKSSTYYTNVAAGKAFEFSGTFGGISITNADIMENSFQISEALTSDGSLTVGGIVTSQLKLTLNNFEGKFNSLTISEQTLITGTLTVTTNQSITLPTYHVVDWEKSEKVIHVTALDYTDFLNESLAGTLSGATWSAVVSAIAARYSLTVSTSTTASSRLSAASTELPYLNYSIETYKSVLLYIMQKCNLFARINSGTTLYIYYFDFTATPIPITNNMIADLDIEGPHSPTLVGIKPYTADSYEASGTAGYNLLLEGCPFYQTGTAASTILSQVSSLSFYNFTMHCIGDPSVQIGDYIKLDDNRKLPVLYKEYFLGQYMQLGFKWDIDSTASFSQADYGGELYKQIDDIEETANTALSDAATAQSTADGKNTVIYSATQPSTTGRAEGDIWFDTANGYKMSRFHNGAWSAALFNSLAISEIDAGIITAGTLNANRIAGNSIGVSKLDGTITNGDWELDLTNGTFTIGDISADNITAGTITGAVTATNLTMTGGSIDIVTNSGAMDKIRLRMDTYDLLIYPTSITLKNTATNREISLDPISLAITYGNEHAVYKSSGIDYATTASITMRGTPSSICMRDSGGDDPVAIGYNGTNLWIGAEQTAATHHSGGTYISSGYNGTAGNDTIYVSIPNADNDDADNKGVWHEGNLPMTTTLNTRIGTDASQYAHNTWYNHGSITFQPGTYLIMVTGYYTANADGRRVMLFASSDSSNDPVNGFLIDSRAAVPGVATRLKFQSVETFSSATTYYLRTHQYSTSGTTLNFTARYSCIKIF